MKKAVRIVVLLFLLLALGHLGLYNRDLRQRLTVGNEVVPAAPNTGESFQEAVPRVAGQAYRAVVTINLKEIPRQDIASPFGGFSLLLPENEPINVNVGSGFVVDGEGLVVTNRHVVGEETGIYAVVTAEGREHTISEVYRDNGYDLAILRVEPEDGNTLRVLPLGNSNTLRLGESVLAVGTPFGELTNTVTSGIISGLGRGIVAGSPLGLEAEEIDDVIQTDAAISPGSSGGPLLNLEGEVIGVNTAMAVTGENLGFAIPVEAVKEMLANYREQGG